MIELIDGRLFMLLAENGGANLKANLKTVNELNVFPVPDGDTGTNMTMTLEQAVEAVNCEFNSVSNVSSALAREMMYTARGNSGVILSQFFKGLAIGLTGLEKASIKDFAKALVSASESAYMAVSQPVEGTILTVAREAAIHAEKNCESCTSLIELFDLIIKKAKDTLTKTPELLPTLKQAGVVDSGGAGLLYIFEGMQKYFLGQPIENIENEFPKTEKLQKVSHDADTVFEFGYCTEFILQLLNAKTDIGRFDFNAFKKYINSLGNSVVAVIEGTVIKVHIHTKEPDKVISYALQYGEFVTFKMENMTLQHNEVLIANNFSSSLSNVNIEKKKYAFVAVVTGDGMKQMYLDAGADEIVYGGQTMNPSAKDFIEAFERIDAENIIVLPNNKNVIMAAVQAAECYSGAEVNVVKTVSMCEGYAALLMADTTLENCDDMLTSIKETIENVISAEVTRSIRDTSTDDLDVKKGDYITIAQHKILTSEKDELTAIQRLLDKIIEESKKEIITIFTGKTAMDETSKAIGEYLKDNYKFVDYSIKYGGQETYNYLISFE